MAIWYTDGSQSQASRGIEMIKILKSTLSIPVEFFLKNLPRAVDINTMNFKLICVLSFLLQMHLLLF